MITDENIIELFFARSEQGMRELDIKELINNGALDLSSFNG